MIFFFGFKLETPKYNNTLGYNPLEGYTPERYAIEKMQNEAGVANNLSNRMDEYESAKNEFMAAALEKEMIYEATDEYGLDEGKVDLVKKGEVKRLREKAGRIKIGSAMKRESVPEDKEYGKVDDIRHEIDIITEEIREGIKELKPSDTIPVDYLANLNKFLKKRGITPIPRGVLVGNIENIYNQKMKEFDEKYQNYTKIKKQKREKFLERGRNIEDRRIC